MSPSELRERLAAFADGELDPDCRPEMEAHLETHPEDRAEVERWQALRQSARRALRSEPVPADLGDRIRAGLRPAPKASTRRAPRIYRLGFSGVAVAALITLAVLLLPGAQPIEASGFANIHSGCAVRAHHDTLNVRGDLSWKAVASLDQQGCRDAIRRNAAFPCKIPRFRQRGYYLCGACKCSPSSEVQLVHAYFLNSDADDRIVSVFAVDHRIELQTGGAACPQCQTGQRDYAAGKDNDVELVCWTEGGRSYVLACGKLNQQELVQLADGLTLAALQQIEHRAQLSLASVAQP